MLVSVQFFGRIILFLLFIVIRRCKNRRNFSIGRRTVVLPHTRRRWAFCVMAFGGGLAAALCSMQCFFFFGLTLYLVFYRSLIVLHPLNIFAKFYYFQSISLEKSLNVGNGSRLGDVAEIEAEMFSFAQKFNRRTDLNLALNPPYCQTDVSGRLYCFSFIHFIFTAEILSSSSLLSVCISNPHFS